jgi:hypothetical protein
VYAALGTVVEVVFTALEASAHRSTRSARLEGHTYLWMPPIYALCAVLYEPLHDRLRAAPALGRAAVYAAGIIGVEYASGRLIERVAGVIPWDYRGRSRFQLHGATRFDYAPLWAAAGIALEPVDDALRSVRLGRTAG